jgi:hypothetical protein
MAARSVGPSARARSIDGATCAARAREVSLQQRNVEWRHLTESRCLQCSSNNGKTGTSIHSDGEARSPAHIARFNRSIPCADATGFVLLRGPRCAAGERSFPGSPARRGAGDTARWPLDDGVGVRAMSIFRAGGSVGWRSASGPILCFPRTLRNIARFNRASARMPPGSFSSADHDAFRASVHPQDRPLPACRLANRRSCHVPARTCN